MSQRGECVRRQVGAVIVKITLLSLQDITVRLRVVALMFGWCVPRAFSDAKPGEGTPSQDVKRFMRKRTLSSVRA